LPHRLIGAVIFKKHDQEDISLGTGILISPDIVLIAAHNLYNFKKKAKHKKFWFYLGQSGRLTSYYPVKAVYYPEEFTKTNNATHDYGLLHLSERVPVEGGFLPFNYDF
jgi:V8-like Glu-specific endopeptidase